MNGSMVNGIASDAPPKLGGVSWLTPRDAGYAEKRAVHAKDNEVSPGAIAVPRTADDVAQVVRYAAAHGIPFTVRTGGHDSEARCLAADTLCIDMRGLDRVDVADDRATATLGGGVLGAKVAAELSGRGLVTPCPAVESVGYVGWATMGGWGVFTDNFGFGADQIVGATLVDGRGDVVEADAAALKGLRGGCGNFGVVVDITVRTYELEQVFAGVVILDSSGGLAETFARFVAGVEQLHAKGRIPSAVGIEPFVCSLPGAGPTVFASFVWSSPDAEAAQACLDKVCAVAPVAKSTVSWMGVREWQATGSKAVPYGLFGRPLAVNVSRWSRDALEAMRGVIADMPLEAGAKIQVHGITSKSESATAAGLREASCMNPELRQPHWLVELLGISQDESQRGEVLRWAERSYAALRACDVALASSHPALLHPDHQRPENAFGTELKFVRRLKESWDPAGVFSRALPGIYFPSPISR